MEKSKFRSLTPRPEKFFDSTLPDPLGMMDEEDESVNKQLNLIHKEYDKIKTSNRQKQNFINKLRQDVNAAKRSSSSMFEDRYLLDTRVSRLENYLETVINKRKEEENLMKSYQYLLDRIKEDKNSLDKEFQSKQADLISKKNILTVEEKKAKKQHEKALKDKIQLKLLNDDLEKEKRLQEETLLLIQKKAKERSKAILLLEESSRNRELIADAAQGQVSNAETIQFRNKLLLYQLWYSVLNKRLQNELEKGETVEEPFQKIKTTTGMQTVEEVLTRFLTREEAYKDLIAAVKTSESNLENLKLSLNESKNYLQSLKTKQGEENIHVEHETLRNIKRSLVNYKEMSYKYKNLLQSLHEWARKQLNSMGVNIEEASILVVFAKICEENQKLMEKIQKNIQKNKKLLDDALYLPMSGLLKQNSFVKYFENNCRISPRKLSISEDDTTLLIGN